MKMFLPHLLNCLSSTYFSFAEQLNTGCLKKDFPELGHIPSQMLGCPVPMTGFLPSSLAFQIITTVGFVASLATCLTVCFTASVFVISYWFYCFAFQHSVHFFLPLLLTPHNVICLG